MMDDQAPVGGEVGFPGWHHEEALADGPRGKDCCQALAHAASSRGLISGSAAAPNRPSERSDAQYARTAVMSAVEDAVSGKKARSRRGIGRCLLLDHAEGALLPEKVREPVGALGRGGQP